MTKVGHSVDEDSIERLKFVRFDRELGKTVAFVRMRGGKEKTIPLDAMIDEPAHLFIEFLKRAENGDEEEDTIQVDQNTSVIRLLAPQPSIAAKQVTTSSVSKSTTNGVVSSPDITQKLKKTMMPPEREETYLGKRHAVKLETEQKEQTKRHKKNE